MIASGSANSCDTATLSHKTRLCDLMTSTTALCENPALPSASRSIENQVSDMDDKLFHCILRDKHHVLHQLLPPERTDCGYCLRPRRHDLTLTNKTRLEEQNSY